MILGMSQQDQIKQSPLSMQYTTEACIMSPTEYCAHVRSLTTG